MSVWNGKRCDKAFRNARHQAEFDWRRGLGIRCAAPGAERGTRLSERRFQRRRRAHEGCRDLAVRLRLRRLSRTEQGRPLLDEPSASATVALPHHVLVNAIRRQLAHQLTPRDLAPLARRSVRSEGARMPTRALKGSDSARRLDHLLTLRAKMLVMVAWSGWVKAATKPFPAATSPK